VIFLHDGVVYIYYLDLAVLGVALAAFQGWLGGELVYGDGVFVRAGETVPAEAAKPEGHSHQH